MSPILDALKARERNAPNGMRVDALQQRILDGDRADASCECESSYTCLHKIVSRELNHGSLGENCTNNRRVAVIHGCR